MADTPIGAPSPWVKNLVGQCFGRLIVIAYAGMKCKGALWLCRCDCPEHGEKIVVSRHLTSGGCKSCGCLDREYKASLKTHGGTYTVEFKIWSGIRTRTTNPKYHGWARYGGRGIVMSPEWLNSFETFLADMGPRPAPGMTIERIDNDGPYSKENCKWATKKEQGRNKRNNIRIPFDGENLTLSEWTEKWGFRKNTIRNRLIEGWPMEKIRDTPEEPKRNLPARGRKVS